MEVEKNRTTMKNVMERRGGRIDLNKFSKNKKNYKNSLSDHFESNNINISELSVLSDRTIQHRKNFKINVYSSDKTNARIEKNSNMNNIRKDNIIINEKQLKSHYNSISAPKRCIVKFIESPKKISDYILKEESKNKRKVYKMIFMFENELNNKKNKSRENIYKKYCTNKGTTGIKLYNFKTKTRKNDIILKNSSDNDSSRKKSAVNVIRVNKVKYNLSNIIKIQSFWKGYYFKKLFFKELKRIATSKLNKIISLIVHETRIAYYKFFLFKLKKNYYNSSKRKFYRDNKKINKRNKNDKTDVPKYQNMEIIKKHYNNNIYKKKNKSKRNSLPLNHKRINNIPIQNLKQFSKKKLDSNYDLFNNTYYKKVIETELYSLIKYIIKRNNFLHFPFLLYRLKILRRLNFAEQRYNCLSRIIKIKEKIIIFGYFQKFKNSISLWINSKSCIDTNNGKNIHLNENMNYNSYNQNMIKINKKKNFSQINNKNNNLIEKQNYILILTKIIIKNELNNNKNILEKSFKKWKDDIIKKEIFPNLRNQIKKNDKNKYKRTSLTNKKHIRIKKLNSNSNSMNSKLLYNSPIKPNNSNNNLNSFYSDNVIPKKMKVNKKSILVEPNVWNKGENQNQMIKNNNINNNYYFIAKIANIAKKIVNKNNMFNCFKIWKKEVNL